MRHRELWGFWQSLRKKKTECVSRFRLKLECRPVIVARPVERTTKRVTEKNKHEFECR